MQGRLIWGVVASTVVAALACAALANTAIPPQLQAAHSGVVRDAHSGQPLAGAYVVARWLEQDESIAGVLSGRCLYRVVTRTDADGRFAIPGTQPQFATPRSWMPGERRAYVRELHAYAPGLLETSASESGTLLLSGESISVRRHAQALRDTLAHFECTARFPGPPPIAEPLLAEAYAAACLPESNEAPELRQLFADLHDPSRGTDAVSCAQARQASNSAQ